MSAATLTLAALLSLLPACLGWLPGSGWSPEGASFAALAALPWIALAGLPRLPRPPGAATGRPAPEAPRPGAGGALVVVAAALAPLALGAALDVRAGVEPAAAGWVAALGALFAGVLAAAAESGRRRPLAFGLVWLAVVAVPAGLLAAGAGGLAAHSPLGWFAARVAHPLAPALAAVPWAAAAAVAVLAAVGGGRPEGSPEVSPGAPGAQP